MPTVRAIRRLDPSHPYLSITISGLGLPASSYSKFRTVVSVNGVNKVERNWTYYSTTEYQATFYDDSTSYTINYNDEVVVTAYATLASTNVEYAAGSGKVMITDGDETILGTTTNPVYSTNFQIKNTPLSFTSANYIKAVWNKNGCIEGSSVTPLNIICTYPAPAVEDVPYTPKTIWQQTTPLLGTQVFGCIQDANGKWYNAGYCTIR